MRGGYDKGGKDWVRDRMAVCICYMSDLMCVHCVCIFWHRTGGMKTCRGSGCSGDRCS